MRFKRLTVIAAGIVFFALLALDIAYSQGVWVNLDGIDDEIRVNDSIDLDGFTKATWNIWVKQNSYKANAGLFGKYIVGAGNRAYIIRTAQTDELSVILSLDGTTYSTYTSSSSRNCGIRKTDGWVMLTVVYNGSQLKFYRNSKECETKPVFVASINNSPVPLRLGGGNNVFFNGSIDDAKIYSAEMGIRQIQRLYDESEHGKNLGQSITALLYHQIKTPANTATAVTHADFAAQMAYLNASGFTTITTKDYLDWKNGTFEMPKKTHNFLF